jgi:hypothetical protein
MDSPGSGWEPVAGSHEHGNEPSGSGTMELVSFMLCITFVCACYII